MTTIDLDTKKIDLATKKMRQLQKVQLALEKVNEETKKMVYDMATGMSSLEVIQSFNQEVYDFFALLIIITRRLRVDKEYKIDAHNAFFEKAVKTNVSLPIEQFTLIILEFAPDIYTENEQSFLNMYIPDAKLEAGNEFNIIRSEHFKELWKKLNPEDKISLKDKIILLTTYAHTYFYQTIILIQQTSSN